MYDESIDGKSTTSCSALLLFTIYCYDLFVSSFAPNLWMFCYVESSPAQISVYILSLYSAYTQPVHCLKAQHFYFALKTFDLYCIK